MKVGSCVERQTREVMLSIVPGKKLAGKVLGVLDKYWDTSEGRSIKRHTAIFCEYWRFRAPIDEHISKDPSRCLLWQGPYNGICTYALALPRVVCRRIP